MITRKPARKPGACLLLRRSQQKPVSWNGFAKPPENRARGFEVLRVASVNPNRTARLVQINSATLAKKVDRVSCRIHFATSVRYSAYLDTVDLSRFENRSWLVPIFIEKRSRSRLLKVAAKCTEAAGKEPDSWRALMRANEAFLEACLDPAVQQIVLIDPRAVLGSDGFRQSDESYYLAGLKAAIAASIAAGIIEKPPVEPLAYMIMGAMNAGARLVAYAPDKQRARRELSESADRVWNGLRVRAHR
jgi:hypothetical protein